MTALLSQIFCRKRPCFSIKIKNILICIYLILNVKQSDCIVYGVRDYAQNLYGWRSSEISVASHFQKKFPKDSYINLTIVTSFDDEKDSLIILFSMAKEHFFAVFYTILPSKPYNSV